MATKKQRRRRTKGRRHEYEVVYLDAEGNEVEPPEEATAATNGRAAAKQATREPVRPRGVQPASWRRVLKRGLLFAPAMFLLMSVLEPDTTYAERAFFTVQLLVIFLPFSYLMDRMTYRVWQKRAERERAGGSAAAKPR
ncbi:MAG TPA: hypothetical protein VLB86_04710 [Gaiellaceae bacterium]|nr:hypothetical protein [Gaiellaceae bacterium]